MSEIFFKEFRIFTIPSSVILLNEISKNMSFENGIV